MQAYRAAFRPSDDRDRPYVMLGVSVVCAESDEQAGWLAGSGALALLRLASPRTGVAERACVARSPAAPSPTRAV